MNSVFLADVLRGMSASPRALPSKYFYDRRGSELFDEITRLDEYYLTRTETAIMRENIDDIGASLGQQVVVIEYGSGTSTKTRMLLEHLPPGSTYLPIDISGALLNEVARELASDYPAIRVLPVHADYSSPVDLPQADGRRVVYFPGSTIGNFDPKSAGRFLKRIHSRVGDDGGALVGVDLKKGHDVLLPAYNDVACVTAAFNLNLLVRINRELGANFDTGAFEHRAIYNEEEGRIEMHLVCRRTHTVHLAGHGFEIARGEYIHTENSYKYGRGQFADLAHGAGFRVERVWTDKRDWFAVFLLHAVNTDI
jgi:dimethylhistidine N-methyltransferase